MIYIIAQLWGNFQKNHAGYPHICHLLEKEYPHKYKVVDCKPPTEKSNNMLKNILHGIYNKLTNYRTFRNYLFEICRETLNGLNSGDSVFLLEYNVPACHQYELACYIKANYYGVKICAMTHLTPSLLQKIPKYEKKLIMWDKPVDMHLTLGSSLTSFLVKCGIPSYKISTGFHAVDLNYYMRDIPITTIPKKLTIITIGAIQRDYKLLSEIVKKRCSDVNWIICKGHNKVDSLFENVENVSLMGFLQEDELRKMMLNSDISLCVLEDTVGSNVITTSMAMGLGVIVSDVGSIRDYCSNENAIFCNNSVDSFVNAIDVVKNRTDILLNMKSASIKMSKNLSIQETNTWFSNLFVKDC